MNVILINKKNRISTKTNTYTNFPLFYFICKVLNVTLQFNIFQQIFVKKKWTFNLKYSNYKNQSCK